MKMPSRFLLFSLSSAVGLLLLLLVHRVEAWWDQGHMLVAAVAKINLRQKEIDKLEKYLSQFDTVYPGMGDMVTASVWSDHVKCWEDEPYCRGLPYFEMLEIFSTWHFINLPYNPQNISVPPQLGLPLRLTGALWFLKKAYASLTRRGVSLNSVEPSSAPTNLACFNTTHLNDLKDRKEHNSEAIPAEEGNNSIAKYSEGDGEREESSGAANALLHNVERSEVDINNNDDNERDAQLAEMFVPSYISVNLHLRLFIHVFGDIHQPLHAIETFSKFFPKGDDGGTRVKVELADVSMGDMRNLHALWDAAAGKFSQNWPSIESKDVIQMARELTKKYPRKYFGARLNGKMDGHHVDEIAEESRDIAKKYVYSEFNFTKDEMDFPYKPSTEYLEKLKEICTEQIVLGGYRLAKVLKAIAARLPDYVPRSGLNRAPNNYQYSYNNTYKHFIKNGNNVEHVDYDSIADYKGDRRRKLNTLKSLHAFTPSGTDDVHAALIQNTYKSANTGNGRNNGRIGQADDDGTESLYSDYDREAAMQYAAAENINVWKIACFFFVCFSLTLCVISICLYKNIVYYKKQLSSPHTAILLH